jgi:hypothetical protein
MKEGAWKHEQLVYGSACEEGTLETGTVPEAQIPFLVEVWAATRETRQNVPDDGNYPVHVIGFTINRTPAIVDSKAYRRGRSRIVEMDLGHLHFKEIKSDPRRV